MNISTQIQSLGQFANWGFTLEGANSHNLLLLHDGELVSHFVPALASDRSIQNECSRHLASKHGWDGCLWSRKEGKR